VARCLPTCIPISASPTIVYPRSRNPRPSHANFSLKIEETHTNCHLQASRGLPSFRKGTGGRRRSLPNALYMTTNRWEGRIYSGGFRTIREEEMAAADYKWKKSVPNSFCHWVMLRRRRCNNRTRRKDLLLKFCAQSCLRNYRRLDSESKSRRNIMTTNNMRRRDNLGTR